jgi:hypothetical protein
MYTPTGMASFCSCERCPRVARESSARSDRSECQNCGLKQHFVDTAASASATVSAAKS